MSDFITLTCPSCGGKLQITNNIDHFACGYCGAEHVVRRGGGIVSLAPVIEGIKMVQTGVDKTASELAIKRLREEIQQLVDQRQEFVDNFNDAGPSGKVILLTVIGVLGVIVGLISSNSKTGGSLLGICSIPFIIGVILLVVAIINRNDAKQQMEQELSKIDPIVSVKNSELRHHEEIVSERGLSKQK